MKAAPVSDFAVNTWIRKDCGVLRDLSPSDIPKQTLQKHIHGIPQGLDISVRGRGTQNNEFLSRAFFTLSEIGGCEIVVFDQGFIGSFHLIGQSDQQ